MKIFMKFKNYILYGLIPLLIVVVSLICFFSIKLNKDNTSKNKISLEEVDKSNDVLNENKEEVIDEIIEYYVDVKGSVNSPGVYKLNSISIINDAINLAGGLNKYADTTCINLSKRITDGMIIYVYDKNETWKLKNEHNTEVLNTNDDKNKEPVICDNLINDAYSEIYNNEIEGSDKSVIKEEVKEDKVNIININTSSISELTTLPGIGESKAKSIIKYREENGNFEKIDDIKNVSGIGESIFNNLKDLITV